MTKPLDLVEKYKLPERVLVVITKTPEGSFYAKFPELPGCMTEADSPLELLENTTDAILTYFDVPRKEALRMNIKYLPPELTKPELTKLPIKIEAKTDFGLFFASSSYGYHSSFR